MHKINLQQKSIFGSSFAKLLTAFLILSVFSPLSFNALQVSAQQAGLGILPANPKADQPETKSWIIKTLKPGEKIEEEFVVQNFYSTNKDIEIHVNDATQSKDGGFDYKQNYEEKTGASKWVKLEKNKITVESKKQTKVKFTLEVPQNTAPGEYAGVISVQTAPEDAGGNILTLQRTGMRFYITVPGDLELNTKVNNFKFISTTSAFYQESINAGNLSNLDKASIQTELQNLGNIYANVSGSLEVQTPSGEKKNTNFNIDLAPGGSPVLAMTNLDKTWQIGTYQATLKLTTVPKIASGKENVKNQNQVQEFKDQIVITQEILDKIKSDMAAGRREIKASQDKVQAGAIVDNGSLSSSSSSSISSTSSSINTEEGKQEQKDNSLLYITIIGVVFITIILAVIIFLLSKKNGQKDKQEEQTSTPTPTKTESVSTETEEQNKTKENDTQE